jgi:hypothetical protein
MVSKKPDMIAYIYNPSTWGAKPRGSRVQRQPGLHRMTLSQKKKGKQKDKRYYSKKRSKRILVSGSSVTPKHQECLVWRKERVCLLLHTCS